MISNITYPRTAAAIESAQIFSGNCYKDLIQNGFLPYRSGSGLYDKMQTRSLGLQKLLYQLKTTIDPDGIIAPGKNNTN